MTSSLNTIKGIALWTFITLSHTSCDYIIERNPIGYEISESAKTRINVYKDEAKLLLKASTNNLDILKLCEVIKRVDTQNSVGHLTDRLENVHFEISRKYDDLAEDKLISIPSYTRSDMELSIEHEDLEVFIASNLKAILDKTENQIELLQALGNVTNNIDFKVLVIKDTKKLNSNVQEIERTLNMLNNRTQHQLMTKNYYYEKYKHSTRS